MIVRSALVAVLAALGAVEALEAQEGWLQPAEGVGFSVEAAVPSFSNGQFRALEARGAVIYPITPRMTLVGTLGMVGASAEGLTPSVVVSNASASLQLGGRGTFVTLTLTLPTTGHLTNQAYGADAGLLLDLERPERYTPRALAFALSVTPRWRLGGSSVFGARVGVASVAPSAFRREFYGRYELFGTVEGERISIIGDISGATFLGGDAQGFGERSVQHATLVVAASSVPSRPAFWMRVALDADARAATDLVAGIRFRF